MLENFRSLHEPVKDKVALGLRTFRDVMRNWPDWEFGIDRENVRHRTSNKIRYRRKILLGPVARIDLRGAQKQISNRNLEEQVRESPGHPGNILLPLWVGKYLVLIGYPNKVLMGFQNSRSKE